MKSTFQNVVELLEQIKEARGKNKKMKLLKQMGAHADTRQMFREMLTYTYHPYWNYWIKVDATDYAYKVCINNALRNSLWTDCMELLEALKMRVYVGTEARKRVTAFLHQSPRRAAYWLAQVFQRSFEIGLQIDSFEKVFPKIVVKIKPMLCGKWDKESIPFGGDVVIEDKLDGDRCILVFDQAGNGAAVSRSGMPFSNMEHVIEELQAKVKPRSVVYDGEGRAKNWGETSGLAHTKKKVKNSLIFYAFDSLVLRDWMKQRNDEKYFARRARLHKLAAAHLKYTTINPVVYMSKKATVEVISKLAKKRVAKGAEGIVIKDPDSVYEFKRSDSWLKDKFKDNVDLTVIGAEEGTNKNAGKLGALVCKGKYDGVRIQTQVGQGLSDAIRKKLWKKHLNRTLKGTVIEVEHYGLTSLLRKHSKGKPSALRNAVFLRVREDKRER